MTERSKRKRNFEKNAIPTKRRKCETAGRSSEDSHVKNLSPGKV